MITRLSLYNRAAAILFPIISFTICTVSLLFLQEIRDPLRTANLAWGFGHQRFLLIMALAGLVLGVADWLFPERKKFLISLSTILSALVGYLGWALTVLIVEL